MASNVLLLLAAQSNTGGELERVIQQRLGPLLTRVNHLETRMGALEQENSELRRRLQTQTSHSQGTYAIEASVSPFGRSWDEGRRLSSGSDHTCCRWTPADTCGSIEASRLRKCTSLHEYLEDKTTTHEVCDTCRASATLSLDHAPATNALPFCPVSARGMWPVPRLMPFPASAV